MSSGIGYIPIRNDAYIQSTIERNFIVSTICSNSNNNHDDNNNNSTTTNNTKITRLDGRKCNEYRPISIELIRDSNSWYNTSNNNQYYNNSDTNTTSSSTIQQQQQQYYNTTTANVIFHGSGISSSTTTRVSCTVTSEIITPIIDKPNHGIVSFIVDIVPSANTNYRISTPISSSSSTLNNTTTASQSTQQLPNADRYQKLLSNTILRTLEHCFVSSSTASSSSSGCIDTEALCIVPGMYVWKINCTCSILDDSGNVLDACILATNAAIQHYRQPIVDVISSSSSSTVNDNATTCDESLSTKMASTTTTSIVIPKVIPSHIEEPIPLPLLYTPITISFQIMYPIHTNNNNNNNKDQQRMTIIVDPSQGEELCGGGNGGNLGGNMSNSLSGRIILGMNIYNEVCYLDMNLGYNPNLNSHMDDNTDTGRIIQYCYTIAKQHVQSIHSVLETSLSNAHEQDQKEQQQVQIRRYQQEQLQQQQVLLPLPPYPTTFGSSTHFDPNNDDTIVSPPTNPASSSNRIDVEEDNNDNDDDRMYRNRALDYSIGHVASKVRENNDDVRNCTDKSTNKNNHTSSALSSNKKKNSLLETMIQSAKSKLVVDGKQQQQQQHTTHEMTNTNDTIQSKQQQQEDKSLHDDDDDEEEDTMILQSNEFSGLGEQPPPNKKMKK